MNNTLVNQGVTKECVEYCMKSIVRLLNGDTKKFEEYAAKALEIYNKDIEESNWTSCRYKVNGITKEAKVNMLTQEIRDLKGNVLRVGVER